MKRKYKLEESIKQIKQDPKNNKNFINQLINSNLYTPVRNIAEDLKGTSLVFNTLVDNKNHQYLIFFTNIDEIRINEGLSEQNVIEISYYDIITIIFDGKSPYHGFVINPFTDSIIVDREDINHINNKVSFEDTGFSEDTVIFGVPLKYPANEFEFIKQYFSSNESIQKVHFTLMQKGDTETYMFIVEHTLDFDSLKHEIYNTVSFYLPKNYNIDILEFGDNTAKDAIKNSMIMFER